MLLFLPPPQAGSEAEELQFDYRHAFYLATAGGARALGLEGTIGVLRPGADFDAQLVCPALGGNIDVFASDVQHGMADVFQKWPVARPRPLLPGVPRWTGCASP